jgi:hypothetical protein
MVKGLLAHCALLISFFGSDGDRQISKDDTIHTNCDFYRQRQTMKIANVLKAVWYM